MKVLLDTNILIHREARTVVRSDIGTLFRWLDELHYEKCIHPGSIAEIKKHSDPEVVRTLEIKLGSYVVLKTTAPDTPKIKEIRASDQTPNDEIDTSLLAELVANRVDAIITEDRGIHRKAARLGVVNSVFTIDAFLEKVTAENPSLSDYEVLSVRKVHLGAINLQDSFFNSFREDYPGFDHWFNRKADELAYICTADNGSVVAFLYIKREESNENYSDITPSFISARRLKIGTFKVVSNGFKLGERFLKIVFDNASNLRVDEIYVTIFKHRPEQTRLIALLEDWGFSHHGQKTSKAGTEEVYVRNFRPHYEAQDPRRSYPYIRESSRKFIVPIYPEYHTELLPDSILHTEDAADFEDNRPNRNAISKVYISRSMERNLRRGDLIVFYRTNDGEGPAHYRSVATTVGVVLTVTAGIQTFDEFVKACRKRSVFTDQELKKHWDYRKYDRPFVVNFLYVYSFPKRPNLKELRENGIIASAPRGFMQLSEAAFRKLLEIAHVDDRFIVS
ncbi:PIN domain-containing protein [Longimicrobium terrae]|uniref:Putative nucleic acid-binding protein n=1 Tax=Longimicrobium terrae TaxID=1639882 RepID=A0A841GVW7_9BACT|nr:PIN domain-containing protein [Longimicrobium terrae]MBB4635219.1 putative nucleic acid-binding protein [Longimicrobium terrae]MBB6069613.1 putative nucleic acid-binding protein [Longimicrobium terrae]NNC31586.1 hypothetical protein [Longimicrobium terrae]